MVEAGTQTLIALVGYLAIVLGIGYWSSRKVENEEDYFIGGYKVPGFALALSERSTDMSGWLLIGMPGLAWAAGLSAIWILLGTAGGAVFQWVLYSRKFMKEKRRTGAVTPNDYIANKFPGGAKAIRSIGAIIVFIFYIAYVGSQFQAGGKVLDQTFGINPQTGVLIVAAIVIVYALAGGFITVVWTDTLQALLMVVTLVVLPLILIGQVMSDPNLSIMGGLAASGGGRASWLGGKSGAAAGLMLGANLSWFFGYMGGEPHIFVRMMALKNESQRRKGIITAIVWGTLTSIGAFMLGLLARVIHGAPEEIVADREMVLPFMVLEHTPGFVGGVLLAGAIAAMMSTADSQLVMASSAVAEDLYNKVINEGKEFSEKMRLRISRVATLLIGIFGFILVNVAEGYVYEIVGWGWAGLAGAFGPVMTLTFVWDRFNKAGVIASLIVGPVFTIAWIVSGLASEIVTARLLSFPVGFIAAVIATLIWSEADKETEEETVAPES